MYKFGKKNNNAEKKISKISKILKNFFVKNVKKLFDLRKTFYKFILVVASIIIVAPEFDSFVRSLSAFFNCQTGGFFPI